MYSVAAPGVVDEKLVVYIGQKSTWPDPKREKVKTCLCLIKGCNLDRKAYKVIEEALNEMMITSSHLGAGFQVDSIFQLDINGCAHSVAEARGGGFFVRPPSA